MQYDKEVTAVNGLVEFLDRLRSHDGGEARRVQIAVLTTQLEERCNSLRDYEILKALAAGSVQAL
jgi:hypothetical protein